MHAYSCIATLPTGIEATILGTPSINYVCNPEWSRRFSVYDLNVVVNTKEAAQQAIVAILRGQHAGKLPQLPTNGAQQIASTIMDFLPPAGPVQVQGWDVDKPRHKSTIDKFAATIDEIGRGAVEIHESVFLLKPVH